MIDAVARALGMTAAMPELVRHPGGERTGDEKTANDVEPDRCPIHHEVMADRSDTSVGRQALPNGTAAGDGHIHLGMAFHSVSNAFLRLVSRSVEKAPIKERPK